MSAAFAGSRALLWLLVLRLKGRVRHFVRDLRRPLRLLLAIVGVGLIAFLALSPGRTAAREQGLQDGGVAALGTFLLALPLLSTWTAMRQGVLAFQPNEVHFLFPAPVSSRALLLAHAVGTLGKSFLGAFMFALFLRPAGAGYLTVTLGYGLYLLFCVLLQMSVDLSCLRWPAALRRQRARVLMLVLALLLGGAVALAWHRDGRVWNDWQTLRYATLPMVPFATVISGGALPGGLSYGAGVATALGAIALLAARVLAFRGDMREAAHQASLGLAKALEAVRGGRAFGDQPRGLVRGSLLPMLPDLRGAGVHAWRQLTVLLRTRKSYAMLLVMTLAVGASTALTGKSEPVVSAFMMLGVLIVSGPMFVQCDFRSDFDCLPWLRTLPVKPGVLAAGQMLASALVLYVIQLVLASWVLFVCPPEQRLAWVGVFIALPVFNLLQLSVWNGAHLLSPVRPGVATGAPGAAAVLRLYMVILAIALVILAALVLSGLFAASAWFALPLVGVDDTTVRGIAGYLAGLAGLGTLTAVAVWCVGRLFLRVDCSRDLSG